MLISDKPVLMDFNHFQVFSLCSTTQAFGELFSFEAIKCFLTIHLCMGAFCVRPNMPSINGPPPADCRQTCRQLSSKGPAMESQHRTISASSINRPPPANCRQNCKQLPGKGPAITSHKMASEWPVPRFQYHKD